MHDLTTTRFKNPSKNVVVFWVKQQVYKVVNRIAAHRSRFVLVPSMFVKNDVLQFAHLKNPDKVIVTYEAADKIEEPAEVVEGLEHARFIMYVGRPMPHKNLPRLIEAFKLLKEKYPDLALVLAGKKDVLFEQIENRVHSMGVPDIVFTGFVSEGELRWLYEHCAAYVFPSLSEGFGLPSLEAMQHGAPVVSSNATCLPEINGEAAQYFDPTDVNAMALAIESVLTSNELRRTLIERGALQTQKYSWRRMAELTLEAYKRALMKDKD